MGRGCRAADGGQVQTAAPPAAAVAHARRRPERAQAGAEPPADADDLGGPGEGGPGGALALGVADRILLLEYSILPVISPEGCASILWRDAAKIPEAAHQLKLSAPALVALKALPVLILGGFTSVPGAIVGGLIDNIPLTATMIPVVEEIAGDSGDDAYWWALSLGACFGGNATLGFLLGMTPVMGKFFGLPLDVRHVTLSTGALTLAICTLGFTPDTLPLIYAAAAGIAIIGALNFGVSFLLALAVALRAREAKRSDRLRLIVSVLATFFRSPLQFFFPPKQDDATPVHGPVSVPPPPAH